METEHAKATVVEEPAQGQEQEEQQQQPAVTRPPTEAELFYESIRRFINDAPIPQELLERGYQRKVFVHTAAGERIAVSSIGYQNPNHLFFGGISLLTGQETWMITQACSAQVIVRAILPEQEEEPESKIGFPYFADELSPSSD